MRRPQLIAAEDRSNNEGPRGSGVPGSQNAKCNLLAVPVLEQDGSIVGFVTVDNVMDVHPIAHRAGLGL
jgi:hypothetical protein